MSKPFPKTQFISLDPTISKGEIHYVGGASPYLWIGADKGGCYGCVPDKKVKQLRDWCNRILEKHSKS